MRRRWAKPGLVERYDVLELLGDGSYGEVARAFDRKLEQIVAIKREVKLFRGILPSPKGTGCLREVSVLSHLGPHPHVLELRDVILPEGFNGVFVVMDFCE